MDDFNVRIQKSYHTYDSADLWFIRYGQGRKSQRVKRILVEFEDINDTDFLPEPSLTLPLPLLRALAHALVESGELPRDFLANEREMTATRSHLDDLRKIAFNELGVK